MRHYLMSNELIQDQIKHLYNSMSYSLKVKLIFQRVRNSLNVSISNIEYVIAFYLFFEMNEISKL